MRYSGSSPPPQQQQMDEALAALAALLLVARLRPTVEKPTPIPIIGSMRSHGILAVGCLCALAAAPARAGGECLGATLRAFEPGGGEVRMRKPLGRSRRVVRVDERQRERVECLDDETDDACRQRLAGELAHLAGEGQELEIELEGARDGVHAVMVDAAGKTVERRFATYEELADFLDSSETREQGLSLVSAGEAISRQNRVAVVTVVERTTEIVPLGPGLRLLFEPAGSALEAYPGFAAAAGAAGIEIVQWAPRPEDGAVVVDLRCAAGTWEQEGQ